MEQISFCITTYNRVEFTLRSFSKIVNDNRIGEILIVDDESDLDDYLFLIAAVADVPKVKVIRNEKNIGCYQNKYKAISLAAHEYVVIADSDNVFDTDYIDAIYRYNWMPTVAFLPDWAMDMFSYVHFGGVPINRYNVAKYSKEKMFDCIINTMNYFVNRDEFCRIFDKETKRYADDSAYINYKWIEAGNTLFVVPFMRYQHTVHPGSHYQQYAVESASRLSELLEQFKTMS